jgi:hypothetical protein
MPNVKFEVTMDNLLKSGDQALSEIMTALDSDNPNAANVVRDAGGKLVRVEVNLPESASERARAAINGNAGVAVHSVALPDPYFVYSVTLMEKGGGTPLDVSDYITMYAAPALDAGGLGSALPLGKLEQDDTHTVIGANTIGGPGSFFRITNTISPTANMTIGAGFYLDITADAVVTRFTLAQTHDIVGAGFMDFWMAADGKSYVAQRSAATNAIAPRSYADAVAAGAA